MLRKKWDEYVIDRELTWKRAIERNADLQEENEKLKKEIKRLDNLVAKLHADCFYYENHREPKEKEEEPELPF